MERLVLEYEAAKEQENLAKQHRLKLEQEIIKQAKNEKLEGTEVFTLNPTLKLVVTNSLTRILDDASYFIQKFPPEVSFMKVKTEIDLK